MEEEDLKYEKKSEERIVTGALERLEDLALEDLAEEAGQIEDMQNIEGETAMGSPEGRMAHPVVGIEQIMSLTGQLKERIGDLENQLSSMLRPEQSRASEVKNASDPDADKRSLLMERMEVAESLVSGCIGHLNNVIERLDI